VVLEQQKRCSKTPPSFALTPWSCLLHRVLELRCFARKLGRVGGVQLWSHAQQDLRYISLQVNNTCGSHE
jgi:hypothetical protein